MFQAEDMKEAQAEILRIKSGGNEYEIEQIAVKDVDEYFEIPHTGVHICSFLHFFFIDLTI